MNKLNLIDEYIIERKNRKIDDLLTMILTAQTLMNDPINSNSLSASLRVKLGYTTFGLSNHEYGYYYITRCASEKIFNKEVFSGNIARNLTFIGKNPAPVNQTTQSSITKIIEKIKDIYNDLKSIDNKHYYYDIGFNDHTFIIAKYNNNFRIIQSWMLKYQLENVIFDNDIHYSFPRFITLLFIYQYYMCMGSSVDLIQIIMRVLECLRLQAKQYLEEFKNLFIMIFSKELHISGQTFNLHIVKNSENYLCPSKNLQIAIMKYEFNPDLVLAKYNGLQLTATTRTIKFYPKVEAYYRAKMNVLYPFYDFINPQVNVNDNIAQIINYNIYPYLSKDHHFDSIHLNYIIKNYNIKLDPKLILSRLTELANIKNKRDSELVKMHNTQIQNKKETILSIYKNVNMEQVGGASTIVTETQTQNQTQEIKILKLSNLSLLSKQEKNENSDEYINSKLLMNDLQNKLANNKILEPFTTLDLTTKLSDTDIQELNQIYHIVKNDTIQLINDHIKVTFEALLIKLNTTQQLVLIIKFYLINPNLMSILIDFINNSKREVYDFISEILSNDIIPNFYSLSHREQVKLIKQLDIIETINQNKEIIICVLSKIVFELPNEMNQINTYQAEISDISDNKFSDKIITNYVLPIISSGKESDKLKTLMAFKMKTKSESGINYLNNLLDSEIVFFGHA